MIVAMYMLMSLLAGIAKVVVCSFSCGQKLYHAFPVSHLLIPLTVIGWLSTNIQG